jgi:serine/threonine-protein kinase SRPK3
LKLDNIQITLPEHQETYLDSFCAEEKSLPSLSKPSSNDTWIVASREMKQDEFGYPILCDLGSAVHIDEGYDGPVQAIPFRAPEVILGAEWDQKIDIWSFGVLVSSKATRKRITADEYRCGNCSLLNACSATN